MKSSSNHYIIYDLIARNVTQYAPKTVIEKVAIFLISRNNFKTDMDEFSKIAYLRELDSSKQCELLFSLDVELENLGTLQEDIRAVRQITDTVESLLQHTANKVTKYINTLKEKLGKDTVEIDVPVDLKSGSKQKSLDRKLTLKNLITSNINKIMFHIFDKSYYIVINAPLVKEMKLPLVIYAHFTVQPTFIQLLFTENNLCEYVWYKSKSKENWTEVGNTYRYRPSDDDIDYYLKLVCVPCNSILTGPPSEAISENKVERMGELPACPFENRHKFTRNKLEKKNFRFVCYNVLSSRYADANDAFPYCPPKALARDYRKQLISKELLGYQADIMCLQEVDSFLYTSYYKDIFKNENYMSLYHKKGNRIPEGLTCLFDKSRFKKVEDQQIIYSEEIKKHKMFAHLWDFVRVNEDLKERFLKQMSSLQITVLRMKISRKERFIVVGNTHLFYHPEAELVRIVQICMATTYLNSVRENYARSKGNHKVTVILCGDFNSVPSSSVYEYMVNGKLDRTHSIFKDTKNSIDLFHNFQFESACGTPKYTNYTHDFKDCLDYIFVERNHMNIKKIVPFPSDEELAIYEGLPNDVYPSDHLALIVDLEINGSPIIY